MIFLLLLNKRLRAAIAAEEPEMMGLSMQQEGRAGGGIVIGDTAGCSSHFSTERCVASMARPLV